MVCELETYLFSLSLELGQKFILFNYWTVGLALSYHQTVKYAVSNYRTVKHPLSDGVCPIMPLSLFCPCLSLFWFWLSLLCPWLSLFCPWLSLFCPWLHLELHCNGKNLKSSIFDIFLEKIDFFFFIKQTMLVWPSSICG